mgnify:CR=1 FL=1
MDINKIDWEAVKQDIINNISNERIWGLGGSEFSDDNIENLEEDLSMIENEEYEKLIEKYDEDYFEDFLK